MRLGFVGLGSIGTPMARHWLDWPDGLVVCDVRTEAAAEFVEQGATAVATAADVGAAAQLISVMVLDDAQVNDVVGQLLTTAAAGTVIAVHSTIRPETAEKLAADAASRDVHLVDAPVSGGMGGAYKGTLVVLAGGEPEAVERCREPFAKWASLVTYFGPAGAGTRAKLARNLLHFTAFAAAGEAARLAEAAGIDLTGFGEVVRHSDRVTGGPGAILVRPTAEPLGSEDPMYGIFEHARTLGEKDLTLALELGDALDVELPLARLALQQLGDALGVPNGTREDVG